MLSWSGCCFGGVLDRVAGRRLGGDGVAGVWVSYFTGYRWLAEAGGPDALGLAGTRGRPWGGRKSEEVRDVFWAELRRGATITAAARAAGVARQTGAAWLTEAGGVPPRVIDLQLEAAVISGSGSLSFTDRCRIEDLVKVGYSPARIADRGPSPVHDHPRAGPGRPHGQSRYRAVIAQNRVDQNRRRAGRPAKLVAARRLFAEVVERLAQRHSPEQIAGRLKRDFPTIRRCGCRTRRSTRPSTSDPTASWPSRSNRRCAPAGSAANPKGGSPSRSCTA